MIVEYNTRWQALKDCKTKTNSPPAFIGNWLSCRASSQALPCPSYHPPPHTHTHTHPLWEWCQPALHKDSRPPQWDSHITSIPSTHLEPVGKREEKVRVTHHITSSSHFIPNLAVALSQGLSKFPWSVNVFVHLHMLALQQSCNLAKELTASQAKRAGTGLSLLSLERIICLKSLFHI